MMLDFTTAALRPDEGREAWREQLATLCGRRATMRFPSEDFRGSIRHREVGGISIAHFAHNVCEIEQNKLPQSGDTCRYAMLIMQLGGRSIVTQGSNELALSTGEFGIIDSFRPFLSRFQGPTRQLIAYLPAAEVTRSRASTVLARPHRVAGHDALAALARSTLLAIARLADQLGDDDAEHARQMLTGVVRRMVDRDRWASIRAEQALPDSRIRAFIDARLADPGLSPAMIASGCGISLRRLHRAFADTPWSVCGWIRHRRLEHCRRDLLDPRQNGLSITQIAFRWGFNDAAHFSRSFREAYRQCPRDLRKQAA